MRRKRRHSNFQADDEGSIPFTRSNFTACNTRTEFIQALILGIPLYPIRVLPFPRLIILSQYLASV
jgi:hypothetical protein